VRGVLWSKGREVKLSIGGETAATGRQRRYLNKLRSSRRHQGTGRLKVYMQIGPDEAGGPSLAPNVQSFYAGGHKPRCRALRRR